MSADPTPVVDSRTASGKRQAAMPFIMVTVLIDMISIGLIVPVLPRLVGSFETTASGQVGAYAIVAMALAFANFIGLPILGALSDRSPEERAKRFGMLGEMFGVGFILGPVLGGLLGGIDLRLPFYCAGVLAVCNWLYGFFVLPESLPLDRRQSFSWARANPIGSLMYLAQLKSMGALLGVVAFASLAQFILQTTWALYTQLKFGWTPSQIGAFNMLGFAAGASLQTLVANAADANTQGRTMGTVANLSSLTVAMTLIHFRRFLADPTVSAVATPSEPRPSPA